LHAQALGSILALENQKNTAFAIVHTSSPALSKLSQGDHEFVASLGLKKKKLENDNT
jgi:hypothetical protein